jgi:threonine/homoserine/homoserine lactone efflux protein
VIDGIHDYWLFVLTGILLNLTPGQDTFFIIGNSLAHGRRIGIASALGVCAGCVVHTFAAALGLSAILQTSATAFLIVKLTGAVYLIYLGVRALASRASLPAGDAMSAALSPGAAFGRGVASNVLNPKVALFFLALLPQFIDSGSDARVGAFLVLGLTFIVTGVIWCTILAVAAARVRSTFVRNPAAYTWLTRASGALFIALGIRLAASER